MDLNEPILSEVANRFVLFPIRFPKIWNMYKSAESAFWTAEEVDLTKDMNDWEKLNKNEQHFIKHVLAFFAGSDGIVNENLSARFMNDVKIPEAKAFYGFQIAMENIHCVTPETEILTKSGYLTICHLDGHTVDVWNGEQFSTVTVHKTSEAAEVFTVKLTNGMELSCTSEHKWLIDGYDERVFTKDLVPGMMIRTYELPEPIELSDPEIFTNVQEHGMLCGMANAVYEPLKFNCRSRLFVPVNYSVNTKLEWLTGLFKTAAIINTSATILNSNQEFLKCVQLLLTTLGVFSCTKQGSLTVTGYDLKKLTDLGLRIDNPALNIVLQNLLVKDRTDFMIAHNEKLPDLSPTYCFNEPLKHTGIFNGILTGQSEMYSLMIDQYIKDPAEKDYLFNAIKNIPCIAKKANWALKWISDTESPYAMRLVAFACVEGIFFSGAFCAIFWLKEKGVLPGLCTSNEFISRDESLHTEFACLLYSMLENKMEDDKVYQMIREAVEIEQEFICDSIPCAMLGMNSDLMSQYIQFVADRLVVQLGYEKIYSVKNPFDFMDRINLSNKTNFFEHRPTDYARPQDQRNFSLDEEF